MAKSKKRKRTDLPSKRGSSTRLSGNRMLEDGKTVMMLAGGFFAGKFIADLVDKGTTTVSGLMGIDGTELKPYLRPLVTVGVGLAANQFFSNQMVKKASIGVAAYGVVEGIQKISGRKVLAGLGNAETLSPQMLMAYQALPHYQMPVMGAEDVSENITAGAARTATENYDLTAGLEMVDDEVGLTAGLLYDEEEFDIAA